MYGWYKITFFLSSFCRALSGAYDENYWDDFMDLDTLWKLVVSHKYVLARS